MPDNKFIQYSYDNAKCVSSFTDYYGTPTSYDYDNMGRLNTISQNNLTTSYQYHQNGSLKKATMPNGTTTDYQYNEMNLLSGYQTKSGSNALDNYEIGYDNGGFKVTEKNLKTSTPQAEFESEYHYDTQGRLDWGYTESGTFDYTYNAYGNMTKKVIGNSGATSFVYDDNNRLTDATSKVGDTTEKTKYYYDKNGNQRSKQKSVYTSAPNTNSSNETIAIAGSNTASSTFSLYNYDEFNRLTDLTEGSTVAKYTYGIDGLRNSKTVNGVKTKQYWGGTNLIAETDASGNVKSKYSYGVDGITSMKDVSGNMSYYLKNAHGDVVGLTDTTGNVKIRYDYDAYGNQANADKNDVNPFKYCGEYADSESGLVYLRARYYDPATSRMLSEDQYWNVNNMIYGDNPGDKPVPNIEAIMQSSNLYVYCMNNPIKYKDPTGKWGALVHGAATRWIFAELGLDNYHANIVANADVATDSGDSDPVWGG